MTMNSNEAGGGLVLVAAAGWAFWHAGERPPQAIPLG